MKLLIVTQKVNKEDPILGFFHSWILEFAKYFEQVAVICLEKGIYELPENVSVYSLGKEENTSKIERIKRFRKYTKELVNEYDAIFVHMNPEYIVLRGLFWKRHHKKIYLWYTHKKVNIWLRIATLLSRQIFTASKESFRLKSKKIKTMGHGIDTDFFIPGSEKRTIPLITVGRISPIKRLEVAIHAIGTLKEKRLTFTVVGKESETSYLKNLRNISKNKTLNVFFEDAVAQDDLKNRYLQKSEIFVHTSETGSLDKAVLEAASSGVIPITSSEAFYDLLKEYKDLLIFEKRNVEELAKKIEHLLQLNETEKEKIRKDLREKIVKHHNLHNLIQNISKEVKS